MSGELVLLESHTSRTAAEPRVLSATRGAPPPAAAKRRGRRRSQLLHLLAETFLPVGYPGSVRAGYLEYQLWDLAQGLCTYLRFTLAINALLSGLGVGDAAASAVSGSLLWAAKDGTAMVSTLAFSWLAATEIGRNVRQWRLAADFANDFMLTLQICAPLFGSAVWFAVLTCAASVFAAVCTVSSVASKTSISEHFALESLSDCVTKEGTQETAVHLVGLIGGAGLVRWLGSSEGAARLLQLWVIFGTLTALHLYANVRAVRTLRFHQINEIRFALLLNAWRSGGDMSVEGVAAAEPRLPPSPFRPRRVRLGPRLDAVQAAARAESVAAAVARAKAAGERFAVVAADKGVLNGRVVFVLLHPGVRDEELLRARYLAEVVAGGSALVDESLEAEWPAFSEALGQAGWDTGKALLTLDVWRYNWADGLADGIGRKGN